MKNEVALPIAEPGKLDRDFAVRWYPSWSDAWKSHDPERLSAIVTEDFVLGSPTTRPTQWFVQGQQAASDCVRYVLGAYPDLFWTVTAPPMDSNPARG